MLPNKKNVKFKDLKAKDGEDVYAKEVKQKSQRLKSKKSVVNKPGAREYLANAAEEAAKSGKASYPRQAEQVMKKNKIKEVSKGKKVMTNPNKGKYGYIA